MVRIKVRMALKGVGRDIKEGDGHDIRKEKRFWDRGKRRTGAVCTLWKTDRSKQGYPNRGKRIVCGSSGAALCRMLCKNLYPLP